MIVFIRAILLYLLIICTMRLMGKRQLGELQPAELVTTILISNIASLPIEDTAIPMAAGAVPIIVIAGFELILSGISLKSRKFRMLLSGTPIAVIENGKLNQQAMRKLRFSIDDLMESLRGCGVFNLEDVWYAVVETTGKISVQQRFSAQTVTAEMLSLKGKDEAPPRVIAADGELIPDEMTACGVTNEWVDNTLRQHHLNLSQVFLMTVASGGRCTIIRRTGPVEET